jgi:hypothetical protein
VLAPRERDDSRIPNVHFPPLTAPAPVSGDFVAPPLLQRRHTTATNRLRDP